MQKLTFRGKSVQLDHLDPFKFRCPCIEIKRDLVIEAAFSNHCYTRGFKASIDTKDEIVVYDSPLRPRVFDEVRHSLSFNLPSIIRSLPTCSVYLTSVQRNYVYGAPMELAGASYEVFFMLQKAKNEADLRLFVESAYALEHPVPRPRRPNSIRFKVLAYKVLSGQRIRFAPR